MALAIGQAFFPKGATLPRVNMQVSPRRTTRFVKSARLSLNGVIVQSEPQALPDFATWPGRSPGVSIEIETTSGERLSRSFGDGPWAIVNFLRQGRTRQSGNSVDVSHQIGPHTLGYRLIFDAPTVPFMMRAFSEFSCPDSFE